MSITIKNSVSYFENNEMCISAVRFHSTLVLIDNETGTLIEIIHDANTIRECVSATSTDLGLRPNSFTKVPVIF